MKKYTAIIMDNDEPTVHNVLWLRQNSRGGYSLWFFNNGKWNQLTGGYGGPSYIPGEGGGEEGPGNDGLREEFEAFKEEVTQYLHDNERVLANSLVRHEQWIEQNSVSNE